MAWSALAVGGAVCAVLAAGPAHADGVEEVVATRAGQAAAPPNAAQIAAAQATRPDTPPLTTQDQIDAFLSHEGEQEPSGGLLSGLQSHIGDPFGPQLAMRNSADRKVHGEVGAMVGTGGARGVWGSATMPVGENGELTLAFSQMKGRGLYGYGGGYGYGGPWGYGPGYGLGGVYGYGLDGYGRSDRTTRTTLGGSFSWSADKASAAEAMR